MNILINGSKGQLPVKSGPTSGFQISNMLAIKRSAGVSPEVNLMEYIHIYHICLCQM